eukprot:4442744-Prymnesium_polylepis.1
MSCVRLPSPVPSSRLPSGSVWSRLSRLVPSASRPIPSPVFRLPSFRLPSPVSRLLSTPLSSASHTPRLGALDGEYARCRLNTAYVVSGKAGLN